MLVQPGLCRTCSETTLLVFPRGGSFVCIRFIQIKLLLIIWFNLMQIKVSSVNARIENKKYKMSKVLYVLQCLVHISCYFQCLLLPPIKTWPYTYGWTFSCWLRLDPVTGVTVERERPYLYWYVYTSLSL